MGKQPTRNAPKSFEQILAEAKSKEVTNTGAYTGGQEFIKPSHTGQVITNDQVESFNKNNTSGIFDVQEAAQYDHGLAERKKTVQAAKERTQQDLANAPVGEVEAAVKQENPVQYKQLKEIKKEKQTVDNKNLSWTEKLGLFGAAQPMNMAGFTANILSGLISPDLGVNEKDTKKSRELGDKIHSIQAPYVSKFIELNKSILEEDMNAYREMPESGILPSMDRAKMEMAMMKRKKMIRDAEAYVNKEGFWSGFLDRDGVIETGTMGVMGLVENALLVGPTVKKQQDIKSGKSKETLTPAEERLLKTVADQQDFDMEKQELNYNYLHGTGNDLMGSVGFMAGLGGASAVTAGVKIGTKIANKTAKYLVEKGTQAIINAAIMPSSYGAAGENYAGNIQYDPETNEIFVRGDLQKRMVGEMEDNKAAAIIEHKKLKIKLGQGTLTEADKTLYEELDQRLGYQPGLTTFDDLIAATREQYEPMSFGRSVQHAYTANLAEAAIEKIGGKYIEDGLAWMGGSKTMLGRGMNATTNALNKYDRRLFGGRVGRGTRALNKYTGDQIQSIPSEMLEEYAVSPFHALNDWSTEPLTSWADVQSHIDVAVQTGIMGIGFRGVGAVMSYREKYANPELYAERKRLKEVFQNMNNAVTDEDIRDSVDLFTSISRSGFDAQKAKVKKLKAEGKEKEAGMLEKKLFRNMIMSAFQTGTINDFEESLGKVATNANLDKGTVEQAQKALGKLQAVKKTHETYKDLPNVGQMVGMAMSVQEARENLNILDEHYDASAEEAHADLKEWYEDMDLEGYELDALFSDKPLEDETENENFQFYKKLLAEAEIPSIEKLHTNRLARDETREVIKDLKSEMKRQSSHEFQTSLKQKAVFVDAFNKEYQNRAASTWKKADAETQEKYYYQARETIAAKRKSSLWNKTKDMLGSQDAVSLAKKLYEKDVAESGYKLTEAEVDNIASTLPGTVTKGLSEYDLQTITNQYKDNIRKNNFLKKLKEKEDSKKEFPPKEKEKKDEVLDEFGKGLEEIGKQLHESGNTESQYDTETAANLFGNQSPMSEGPSLEETKKIAALVDKAAKDIEAQTGKKPDFKTLVQTFADKLGKETAKNIFDKLAMGWKHLGNEVDATKVFNEVFDPLKESLGSIAAELEGFQPLEEVADEEVIEESKKTLEEIEKEQAPKVFQKNVSSNITYQKIGGGLTTDSNLQLGFSALNYVNKVIDGVKKKVTVFNNQLRDSSSLKFTDLIDPNKNNVGDKLFIAAAKEDTWKNIEIRTGYDANGAPVMEIFQTWFDNQQKVNPQVDFRTTADFAEMIPIYATNESGIPVAYIHDTGWYNPHNVADPNGGDPTEVIEQGKENIRKIRRMVLDGEINQIEITEKKEGIYYEIPVDQPLISIEEANPQSIMAMQKGKTLFVGGNKPFTQGEKRIIINKKKDFDKGGSHLWDLRLMGHNEKGVPLYRAFKVFRKADNGLDGIPESSFETMKWLYATHAILSDNKKAQEMFNENIKGTKYDVPKEKAEQIAKEIMKISRINVRDLASVHDMIEAYGGLQAKKADGSTTRAPIVNYAKKMYKTDTTANSFGANGNLNILTNAKNMPVISADGTVTDTGKNYESFLKSVLLTRVKSFNVGTEQKPSYATSIQPVIKYKPVGDFAEKAPDLQEIERKKQLSNQRTKEALQAFDLEPTDPLFTEAETELIESFEESLTASGFNVDELTEDVDVDDLDMDALEALLGNQSPMPIDDLDLLKNIFNVANKLSQKEENFVIKFLYNKLLESIDKKHDGKVTKQILFDELRGSFESIVASDRIAKREQLKALIPLYKKDPNPRLKKYLIANKVVLEKYDSIEQNWDSIVGKAVEHATKYTEIKETVEDLDQDEADQSQREKDYSKEAIEESAKDKTSYALRRFMSGIADKNPDGTDKTGPFGLTDYLSFNDVFNSVAQFMNAETDIEPDFDIMMTKLADMAKGQPWVQNLVDKLNNEATEQLKRQFVQVYAKHALSMKFTMYSVDNNGTVLKLYDTNANEITRIVRDQWKNHFKATSKLVSTKNGYHINKEYAKSLRAKFRDLSSESNEQDLRNFLAEFGVEMANETWKELKEGSFYSSTGGRVSFEEQFTDNSGIFKKLGQYLDKIILEEDTEFDIKEKNHPHFDMNSILKTLSRMQAKYSTQSMTLTFRDGSKQISGQVPPSYVTDMISRLKTDATNGERGVIEKLQGKSLTKQSTMLQLLEKEGGFAGKFAINHIGITALKQLGKSTGSFSSITDLNSKDHDLTKIGGIQDMRQGEIGLKQWGLSMRMGNVFLPTMSDKTRMMSLQTGIFNFFSESGIAFKKNDQGNFEFSDSLRELAYEKFVLPELERIMTYHKKNAKVEGSAKTNIKNYDKAAQIFNFIPELNNVKVGEKGVRLIKHIAENSTFHDLATVEELAKEELTKVVENYLLQQVSEKMAIWEGFTERNDKGEVTKLPFFDKDYLATNEGSLDDKFQLAALDYVLNSNFANVDSLSVFAGDIAQYAKDSDFTEEHPYDQEDDFYKEFAQKTDVNVGKRMALLIAPGNKQANSVGKSYRQIFLSDVDDMSQNAEYLIKSFYGETAFNDEVKDLMSKYNNTEDKHTKAGIRKTLATAFPKIGDYFKLESTDAQEYTTVKEHVDVMYDAGRISDQQYETLKEKIAAQKLAEKQGKAIPKSALITKEEMDMVFQPMKPVYTGQIEDEQDLNKDVMRTVYIKSSSFPLLPQFTAGTSLDGLRKKMEEIEETTGENVRASYQTANKVGAVKNAVDAFAEGTTTDMMMAASLRLNREDFKIQQDVPFKSDKKKKDEISMGTQIFKLLMGNGIMGMKGFKMPALIEFDADGKEIESTGERTLDGQAMHEEFTKVFTEMVDIKRKELYKELGLNDDGKPSNQSEFVQKLQELLHKEASKRNYPLQDVKGLELEEKNVYDKDGKLVRTYHDFKIPLWLATNGNRYESLLNSIVTNRVMKHKIPGNSFVVGSESGMKFNTPDADGKIPGVENSRIIYLDNYNGKELQATNIKDGKLQKPQVFIPSKFKDPDGKLIDLFEGLAIGADGKQNGKYIYERANGSLGLKTSMFDTELLAGFSFRTPTSSHVSGSSVEIAGFLPPESGDLMVVPKNFTKQKGLDYDVDKENMYMLNHVKDYKTGKVEVLTARHKKKRLDSLAKALEKFQSEGAFPKGKLAGPGIASFDAMFFKKLMNEVREQLGEEFTDELGDEMITEVIFNPEFNIQQKIDKVEMEYDKKLMENEFVRIHKAIFQNPAIELQNKINSVLSMKFANDQADMIEKFKGSGDTNQFSLLSEEHQKRKMGLGAAGKLAIGVYSNFLTFHGLAQQANVPMYIQEQVPNEDGEGTHPEPRDIRIGNIVNKGGKFGAVKTLNPLTSEFDGDRDVSEVYGERQNTATDNEKEQILGRVNINSTTIGVDSLLTALGFDKDENGNSVAYMLMSQPIMVEYVEKLANSRGITAEYNPDAQNELIAELIGTYSDGRYLYDPTYGTIVDTMDDQVVDLSQELTGEEMHKNLSGSYTNGTVQVAALAKFLELDKVAKKLTAFQKVLNVNNLGKSIIESNDMYDRLVKANDTGDFANLNQLIGTFAELKSGEAVPQGYYMLDGGIMVKPNTAQGAIVVNGLIMAQKLWGDFFPYADHNFKHVINEILEVANIDVESDYKRIETTHEIVKEIKKYIYSGEMNGLFQGNPSTQRAELFMDSDSNTSISRYLSLLGTNEVGEFSRGLKVVKNNKLMNKLTYEVNMDGAPSIVKYNNTQSDNFDEDYLYNSFPELIIENKPLPPIMRNGVMVPYSTRMLAQDMITYAYLEGGVQEAIQFIKYVPIEYLQAVKIKHPGMPKLAVNEMFQMYSNRMAADIFGRVLGVPSSDKADGVKELHSVSSFTRQFIQHSPEKAKQYTPDERAKLFAPQTTKNGVMETFVLRDEEMAAPKFITIKQKTKSKKKQDKYHLYERTSELGYTRIDVLGTHGMNEYQYTGNMADRATSIIKPEVKAAAVTKETKDVLPGKKTTPVSDKDMPFDIKDTDSIEQIINKIVNSNMEFEEKGLVKEMLTYLKPMLKSNLQFKLSTEVWGGLFSPASVMVYLNPDAMKKAGPQATAKIFLHELVHSVTSLELLKYINEDGLTLKQGVNAPDYVLEMMVMFNKYRKLVGTKQLEEFQKRFDAKNVSNDDIQLIYPATDIFEFFSGLITEPRLRERLSKEPYGESGKTYIEKFKELLSKLLKNLHPEKTTLSDAALATMFEFIEKENKGMKPRTMISTKLPAEQDWEDYTKIKTGENYYFPDKEGNINYGTVTGMDYYDEVGDVYVVQVGDKSIMVPAEDIIITDVRKAAEQYQEQLAEAEELSKNLKQNKQENNDVDGNQMPLNVTFTQEDINLLPDCI